MQSPLSRLVAANNKTKRRFYNLLKSMLKTTRNVQGLRVYLYKFMLYINLQNIKISRLFFILNNKKK